MKKSVLIGITIFLFGIIAFLFLPIFDIQQLIVSGNNFVSQDKISDTISFGTGKNIFLFNKHEAKKKLLKNYFISDAKIKIVLPNTISVQIKERNPCCYIKFLNDSFVLIDNEGFVIEVAKACDKNFPLVDGINFDSFIVGKNLEVKNKDSFETAIKLANIIIKNKIEKISVLIDISDINGIHLYVKNIDIIFGNITDCDQKISLLKSILDSNSDYLDKTGTLDLQNINSLPVFKFIT